MASVFFRAGVVIVVARSDGQVLAFERRDRPGSWQFPQGGLQPGESPIEAAWRELQEETGLGPGDVRLTGEYQHWVVYEWPSDRREPDRMGQVQRWFFFDLLDDSLEPRPDGREFVDWRWTTTSWLLEAVVPFRRPAYLQVLG